MTTPSQKVASTRKENMKLHTAVFKEGLLQSTLIDIVDFGFLCGTVWFNYHYVGNSKFLNGIILVMFIITVVSKASGQTKRFTNKKDLQKWVDSL